MLPGAVADEPSPGGDAEEPDVMQEWASLVDEAPVVTSAESAAARAKGSGLLRFRGAVMQVDKIRSASKYLATSLASKKLAAASLLDDESSRSTLRDRDASIGASAIDDEGCPAIVKAAGEGEASELRRLLGSLPTSQTITAAEELDSLRIVERNGHNVNSPNADGIDLNNWNDHGQNAIIKATRNNHRRCVQILLDVGADPQVTDSKYRSAWYYACFGVNIPKGEHKAMVKLLTQGVETKDVASVITSEVVLCTCYTRNDGVTWAVVSTQATRRRLIFMGLFLTDCLRLQLDALKCEVTSKDSTGRCEFLFHDLHILDNPTAVMTWPVRPRPTSYLF